MFSMDEIDNLDESSRKKLPIDMTDNSDFVSSLVSVANLIERMNFTEEEDRTRFQLHIINMMCNEDDIDHKLAVYTSLSLSAVVSLCLISLEQSESKERFLSYFREIIIQPLFKNQDEGPGYEE